ncbi:GMC family oxidoreductase [Pseudoalteromonas sp. JBTF-M23]|uniref:GMC family oxidoreductase n=1 Tax=Pseudoalteromonas caenipelagi TaxID=2726988 RepID=A0A849VHE3_9GAMM|nr:GMC family oxidoreductase [Pseudoalteromonas caenipelagi]NOU52230.1 GMC family oxidoreductase [Pseudoalteromonas caenipelagi]
MTDLYIKNSKEKFDVLVVGSGITGGWAAKEFCERGFKTLMIERGRIVEHRKDYIGEHKGPWLFDNRMKVDNLLVEQQYNVQKRCYAFSDSTKHFFGNDRDLPYTTAQGTGFSWIRANQLGGKSLLWHRQSYRFNQWDFEANKADGYGNDWPIRYNDLAPWYAHVEAHVGIAANMDNLDTLPNSVSLPAFEWTAPERMLKDKLAKLYPDRPMVMGRAAHLTKPTELHLAQGRVQCQARNECQKGCSFGAYFSTQSSTLPAAAKTGNLHIAPNSVVHSLIYDRNRNRVVGVRVVDNESLETREYYAHMVFLCASTLGSTQILLNSKSKTFPNGIANSSGVLGHYLMDHNYNARAVGVVEGFDNEYYSGRRPTSPYIPNFQYKPSRYAMDYKRGYALAAWSSREDWRAKSSSDGFGADFKNNMTQAGRWLFGLSAQGEMLPRYENHVSLHPTKTDKWGVPQLLINCQWSDNEKLMMDDAAQTAKNMLFKAGLKDVYCYTRYHERHPGLAIHEVGTARMGSDPKESVLNGFNQSHDIPNLFVTDGASFCSTATVNPSLTFMAITARAVDYAAKEFKNRRI